MESTENSTIKAVIVDDQEIIRDAFGALVEQEPSISVIGSLSDGAEAVEKMRALAPSVFVMVVKMPRLDGLAAAQQIREKQPDIGTVLLSSYNDSDYIREFLKGDPRGKAEKWQWMAWPLFL